MVGHKLTCGCGPAELLTQTSLLVCKTSVTSPVPVPVPLVGRGTHAAPDQYIVMRVEPLPAVQLAVLQSVTMERAWLAGRLAYVTSGILNSRVLLVRSTVLHKTMAGVGVPVLLIQMPLVDPVGTMFAFRVMLGLIALSGMYCAA